MAIFGIYVKFLGCNAKIAFFRLPGSCCSFENNPRRGTAERIGLWDPKDRVVGPIATETNPRSTFSTRVNPRIKIPSNLGKL